MEYKNISIDFNNKNSKNPLHDDIEYSTVSSITNPSYETIDNLLMNQYITSNNLIK
ncbi:hypothetical protein [Clostridium tarantellae]|uniref:hypothetical protein n=1 Tax=Clostridium tarantellae TaxID=39493 RepID=UPI00147817D1|nr:hypothetical protein [Clostridium tarantellae]